MRIEEKMGKFMIVDFNEIEAYKIASKIEQDGIEFYGNIIQNIKDEKIKKGLQFLLEEEKKHLKFFQESLSCVRRTKEDGFEEDDLLNYMSYGVFETFEKIKQTGNKINDINGALQLGIAIEENSIKFYQSCIDNITSSETQNELKIILDEERRHKILFENILNNFNAKN